MERHFGAALLGEYFSIPFTDDCDALFPLSGSLGPDGIAQMRSRLEDLAREFDSQLARDACLPAGRGADRRQSDVGSKAVDAAGLGPVSEFATRLTHGGDAVG